MATLANIEQQIGQLNISDESDDDFDEDSFDRDDEKLSTITEGLLLHTFLPKKTCNDYQNYLPEIEIKLLENFTTSIKSLLATCSNHKLESVKLMFEKWLTIQPTAHNYTQFVTNFPKEITALKPGSCIPIYVLNQNCMLLITKYFDSENESISLSTFRCSLPNEVVMSSVLGGPSMTIPETKETILNVDMLKSPALSKHLYDLAIGKINVSDLKTSRLRPSHYITTNDVIDPILVTDWLVGLLVPQEPHSDQENSSDHFQIKKKFRDQISINEGDDYPNCSPFRRSGMYMALKGSLQLKILECMEESKDQAKLVYKIIMLKILADFASQSKINDVNGVDLGSQLLAKLGRRVQKLEILPTVEPQWIHKLKFECLSSVDIIVDQLSDQMRNIWEKAITPEANDLDNPLDLSPEDAQENLHHHLPELDKFVTKMTDFFGKSSTSKTKEPSGPKASEVFARYTDASSIINASKNLKSIPSIHVWLHDTGYFIKFCSKFESLDPSKISQLLTIYIATAQAHYKTDPLGQSQIYLVSFKGLEVLDKILTKTYPLLLHYKSEINVLLFDYLLLPFKKDMLLLNVIIIYFKNRDENANLPGVLSSNTVSNKTFSVNFAQQNKEMRSLRATIIAQMEVDIQEKYKEIDEAVNEYKKLAGQYQNSNCSCYTETSCGVPIKIRCDRCELPSIIRSHRKSVRRYERPLPQEETLQWAVIFELRIPQKFAAFRNYLAYVKYELWGDAVLNENHVSEFWLGYEGLKDNVLPTSENRKLRKKTNTIQLVSFARPTTSKSLRIMGHLDICKDAKEMYIVYNGMDCHFHYNGRKEPFNLSICKICSFQLSTTKNSEPYVKSNLQITLEDTNHSQNSILARQNECHQKLSLEEFLAFGSLRAGHRIQLRNLYQSIVQGSLSLDQEPCLALILQTIWQMGPMLENNKRESHLDFSENDSQFAEEFLETLDDLIKINKENRHNILILLNVVIITRRIGDMLADLQEKSYSVLKKCRNILSGWMTHIEEALDKQETSTDFAVTTSLQTNMLEILLCSTLTYNISSPEDLTSVLKDSDDVELWLQTQFVKNKFENQLNSTSEFFQILWNFGKNVALNLQIENQVALHENIIEDGLKSFVSKNWNKSLECTFKSIDFPFRDKNKGSLVVIEYLEVDQETQVEGITHQVTFDFIRGQFMVNGYSSSFCPLEITKHKLFKMYFKEETNLRVQQQNEKLTRTIAPFKGHQYEFHLDCCNSTPISIKPKGKRKGKKKSETSIKNNNDLVILEIQEGNTHPNKLALVDPNFFSNALSKYFMENYTHWLDTNNNLVHFRPILASSDQNSEYLLKQVTCALEDEDTMWMLENVVSGEYVLSTNSTWFEQITKRLERLELDDYINVTYDTMNEIATASMRRYNFRFTLDLDEDDMNLRSVEYPDYIVSANQKNIGTLIGLEHGLLLENGEKRLILMPHATIKCSIDANINSSHQKISLCLTENLRQPPCFSYEMDDVLQRLKPYNSKSAWLYLAALHAVTSSSFFPDPFTGVTGMEMAVQILQSACVWSCCPYDEESLTTLNFIRKLSPKRKWYDGYMQKHRKDEDKGSIESVKWPQGIPSLLAFDGYAIIVDKLIEDSENLEMLNRTSSSENNGRNESIYNKTSEKLSLRGYLQNLSFYSLAARLEYPKFFGKGQETLITKQKEENDQQLKLRIPSENLNLLKMQHISFAFFAKSMNSIRNSEFFRENSLGEFLTTDYSLDKANPLISLDYFDEFNTVFSLDFRFSWLKLYDLAISCKSQEDVQLLGLILSAAVYNGTPFEQVANILCVYKAGNKVFPNLPSSSAKLSLQNKYYPRQSTYKSNVIKNILERTANPFTTLPYPVQPETPRTYSKYHWIVDSDSEEEYQIRWDQYNEKLQQFENEMEEYNVENDNYQSRIRDICEKLGAHVESRWPCANISIKSIPDDLKDSDLNLQEALLEINLELGVWYENYELNVFINEVQCKLNQFGENLENSKDFSLLTLLPKTTTMMVEISRSIPNYFENMELYFDLSKARHLREADKVFQTGHYEIENSQQHNLQSQKDVLQKFVAKIINDLYEMLTSTTFNNILYKTGMAPRLAPLYILKFLTNHNKQNENTTALFSYAGALGVLWTHLKRLNRIIQNKNESDIQPETDNPGHENWSPKEHPEWLLLELDLNLMIRPIQVKVAQQMIQMPNGHNGVTQLNMGEGKTSVIVPMLCATLAQTNSQLCRVTVLSSMFKMNYRSLTFAIGGLLNKRVYFIPCRRDMKIDELYLDKIHQVFQDCLKMEDVILTLPEYRLSFRLLAYDKMYKNEWLIGKRMLDVENFLRKYARDVLDESDELLNVKYQLVYTIGERIPIDGGDLRWKTCQKVMKILQKIGIELVEKYGSGMIEFQEDIQRKRPHEFSTFRLLGDSTCLKDLCNLVADSILAELMICEEDKNIVKKFLVEHVERKDHDDVLSRIFLDDNPDVLNQILLLSGYLRRGVLGLALTKRWRVEYGVSSQPNFPRLMAIPFRAKDVAAEKTEFGHPDLAIILTHLSYYYSGLSEKQLDDVFRILKSLQGPEAIYSKWLSKIPKEYVPESLQNYHSLNTEDKHQNVKALKMLTKHKMVIDFYLSHCVFPRESKQFPGKLAMTAWDLCFERQRLPVTGFSGTNDLKELLPILITQQDLRELEETNKKTTQILLRPENGMNHQGFPMGVTCKQVLETMKQDNLTVLIDAGALMLDCTNEQVANLWLETNPNIEAAIYFNENNELLVKTRDQKDGQDTFFDVSPYQGRLEKCGVFLDDQHTRGTDLKFPIGSKACVTVATRMKRDKLIQACMRMRKLGQGHAVTFYLSHEARDKIKGNEISTQSILNWVCENTEESKRDGLLYWALAGRNYAQRLAAEDHFHFPSHQTPYEKVWEDGELLERKLQILAKQCVDDEVVKIIDMYGKYTEMEHLTELVQTWFRLTKGKLVQNSGQEGLNVHNKRKLDYTREAIVEQCLKIDAEKMELSSKGSGMMEEEQEKEFELEIEAEKEEERNIERPSAAEAAIHHLHDNVKALILNGGEIQVDGECFVKLRHVFQNTTFWDQVQPESWKGNVFATNDFVTTITTDYQTDSYLRPIQFLISNKTSSSSSTVQWLAISPYEANELLPYFRGVGNTKCKLHIFSARRYEKQELMLNNHRLHLPATIDLIDSTTALGPSPELMSLLLASGNLYFDSMDEQKAFTTYLSLFPKPWSEEEELAFEQGKINKSGFWLPQFRSFSSSDQQVGFQEDPTGLVKKIMLCRHSSVSDVTHLMQLLNEKCCVDI